jgi:hypothetical protein
VRYLTLLSEVLKGGDGVKLLDEREKMCSEEKGTMHNEQRWSDE